MQVQSVNQQINSPQFGALKSVNVAGIYKKYPEYAKQIIETVNKSQKFKEFCNRFDVDMAVFGKKEQVYSVSSELKLLYKPISKSPIKKFLSNLFISRKELSIPGYGNEYLIEDSLKASTTDLVKKLSSDKDKLLDSNIEYIIGEFDNAMQEVAAKKAAKLEKSQRVLSEKQQRKNNNADLENSINAMMSEINEKK